MTIGLFRAAYESASLEVMRAAGIRRRVVLVGEGESPSRLRQSLAAARGGLSYEFVGAAAPEPVPGIRRLGSHAELAIVLEQVRPDEVILAEADFDERTVLEVVEQAHGQGQRCGSRPIRRSPRPAR